MKLPRSVYERAYRASYRKTSCFNVFPNWAEESQRDLYQGNARNQK